MGKKRDLIQVLLLILIGMFIPFLGSVTLSYGFEIKKISFTFFYFLLIFAFELGFVYLYFTLNNKRANKKMEKYKPK
jgi:hypothetical protein